MALLKEVTTLASVAMPIGESWSVRRCRYGSGDGAPGRLCIATGIHGDEMMGQLIVYLVAQRIMSQSEHLHGTVDIYPMLNPLGLDIGERLVPSSTRLDMNRAFPGNEEGTALESMCHHIMNDMLGADLVLDIHSSTLQKSELYEVRLNAASAQMMLPHARSLCPDLIWIYPDKPIYNAMLTSALCQAGTPALVLETDERRRHPQDATAKIVDGIFCKMKEMGLWTGETISPEASDIPVIRGAENMCRIACSCPGVYVPQDRTGEAVREGDVLGLVIDALTGETMQVISAPTDGLIFSQRGYSAVYPGTLIARLYRKERA